MLSSQLIYPLSGYPNGVMLWVPAGDGPSPIFDIRRQISDSLLALKKRKPTIYFDTDSQGKPNMPDIIHSTFMRPLDVDKYRADFKGFSEYTESINDEIKSGRLFAQELVIREISFMEERVDNSKISGGILTPKDIEEVYFVESLGWVSARGESLHSGVS